MSFVKSLVLILSRYRPRMTTDQRPKTILIFLTNYEQYRLTEHL